MLISAIVMAFMVVVNLAIYAAKTGDPLGLLGGVCCLIYVVHASYRAGRDAKPTEER